MGKTYGYYAVIVSNEVHECDDYLSIKVLTEEGEVRSIRANSRIFSKAQLENKKGKIVVYEKSYYWNLFYFDTDIKLYSFRNLHLLTKRYLDREELTPEEQEEFECDDESIIIAENLDRQTPEMIYLWFDVFVNRNIGDFAIETTDEEYEMIKKYRHLEAPLK